MSRNSKQPRSILSVCLPAMLLAAMCAVPLDAQLQVGEVTKDQVEKLTQGWRGSAFEFDDEALHALAQVHHNADVQVFFDPENRGQRDIPRFLDIVDIVSKLGEAPFSIEFIAVDRKKKQPAWLKAHGIRFFPTFVVSVDGTEVGRIVERAPRGLEADLALLLDGKTTGLVSASENVIWHHLAPPGRHDPRPR